MTAASGRAQPRREPSMMAEGQILSAFHMSLATRSLEQMRQAFHRVGWFIPPWTGVGFLEAMTRAIERKGDSFSQQDLESLLSHLYSVDRLSAMVTERYPVSPHLQEYQFTIAEGVEAHFIGLDRAAVTTLLPVIEGAGKRIAKSSQVQFPRSTIKGFANLADDCKQFVAEKRIGAVYEIVSMLDSFTEFAEKHLYVHSEQYPHRDKTNRHGILHGAYTDADYGRPLNFYKAVGAIEFLCFVASFRARMWCFAPEPTERSKQFSAHYRACIQLGRARPILGDDPIADDVIGESAMALLFK
jgi:hypothetical protein